MNYKRIPREGSFIYEYMGLFENTETPSAYDFWCGMWLISNAVGRRVKVDRPYAPVFLNWYIILVAESGVTRKSTAVRAATELIYDLYNRDELADAMFFISGKTTPEFIEHRMANHSLEYSQAHMAITISELVTFLGREGYTRAMPGLLTDIYDCPSILPGRGSMSHKRHAMNVYPTLLSASAPSWLIKSINPEVVEGGFTSRTIFVHSERRKKRIAWPMALDEEMLGKLRERLSAISIQSKQGAVIELTNAAKERFISWYNNKSESFEPFTRSFESREDAHVLRAAGCLCISDGTWMIDKGHIDVAIRLIDYIKQTSSSIFTETITNDKIIHGIVKIRDSLISAGYNGLGHTTLRRATQHIIAKDDFDIIMSIMHEMGIIQRFEKKDKKGGRPKTIWRATREMSKTDTVDDVASKFIR